MCVCVCVCVNYSSAVSSTAECSEESVWTTAECFGSPTAPWKAMQPLYLLQISPRRLPSTFSYPPGLSPVCPPRDNPGCVWGGWGYKEEKREEKKKRQDSGHDDV